MVLQWSTICNTDRNLSRNSLRTVFRSRGLSSECFKDLNAVVGHRQHESATVVPIDIDLRTSAVIVNVDGNNNYDVGVDTELGYETLANGVSRMLAQRDEEHRDLDKQFKAWIVTRKAEAIRDHTVAGGK
jgi:hypothetical protein